MQNWYYTYMRGDGPFSGIRHPSGVRVGWGIIQCSGSDFDLATAMSHHSDSTILTWDAISEEMAQRIIQEDGERKQEQVRQEACGD